MKEMDTGRTEAFARSEKLENVLGELNALLSPVQEEVNRRFEKPEHPVLLIVGCARGGTTLLMQWLANTGVVAYPTNLASRFYAAPYIGARVQQAFTDLDKGNEIFGSAASASFASNLGKTRGPVEPNEFWYFWRRFFQFGEIQVLSDEALNKVDGARFLAELASFEAALGKPLVLKAMIMNWHLPLLARLLEGAIFLFVRRDPVFNAQSLLMSREKFFGTYDKWYSFKPPEYPQLMERDPYGQVAGQVYYTNRAVARGLEQVAPERVLNIGYRDFCRSPRDSFDALRARMQHMGYPANWEYDGPGSFDITDGVKIPGKQFARIVSAYEEISGETWRQG